MIFGTAISMQDRAQFSEGSALTSTRDDRNNSLLWKKVRTSARQQYATVEQVQKISREIAKQRRRILGGGADAGAAVQDFQIVSDGGDWYNCYTFDGVTAGTQIVKVAKHQDLRCLLPSANPAGGAWVSKLIRTVTYTYTYTAVAGVTLDGVNVVEYTRGVVGDDGSSETDYVTPCLNCLNAGSSPAGAGDIITAVATTFAGPNTLADVTWQALADGRAWASQP